MGSICTASLEAYITTVIFCSPYTMKALALTLLLSTALTKADYATRKIGKLEDMYVRDCERDSSPHGYYGAFLEPCEFSFYSQSEETPCSAHDLIGVGMPLNWALNLTENYNNQDWDQYSSDDMPDPREDLLLWPDQCVGVMPRCYSVAEFESLLNKLIGNGIPVDATHVRVDCRADGLAVTKTVYAFVDGFEKSAPTLVLWAVTVLLFFVCSTMWCCFGCVSLIKGPAPGQRFGKPLCCTASAKSSSGVYIELGPTTDEEARLLK